jgi:aspartyl-tRNA synthetase
MRTHWIEEVFSLEQGKEVRLCGWVEEIRQIGKVTFIILRDETGKIQIKANEKVKIKKEAAIFVFGAVKDEERAPQGKEIEAKKINLLGNVEITLPFYPAKPQAHLTTRLDFRPLDLRCPYVRAIMNVRSCLLTAFRTYFLLLGFEELTPPTLVGSSTEGGAQLFRVDYFDKIAFLAQSPQFYKQMAVIGGMERVFMTCPVFRAEKHDSPHHVNEIYQMDIEVAFSTDDDAISLLKGVVEYMCAKVKETCKKELELIKAPEIKTAIKEITYDEAIRYLTKEGYAVEWGDDLTREMEKALCSALNSDFVLIRNFPTAIRAFYSMPCEENPEICKSFDLIHRGIEISSGAQRIHNPNKLEEVIRTREFDIRQFRRYIDAFKLGAPPHAGWSIGLDRFTMSICGLENIREGIPFPRDKKRIHP